MKKTSKMQPKVMGCILQGIDYVFICVYVFRRIAIIMHLIRAIREIIISVKKNASRPTIIITGKHIMMPIESNIMARIIVPNIPIRRQRIPRRRHSLRGFVNEIAPKISASSTNIKVSTAIARTIHTPVSREANTLNANNTPTIMPTSKLMNMPIQHHAKLKHFTDEFIIKSLFSKIISRSIHDMND